MTDLHQTTRSHSPERQREIDQGLRDEGGALIGGLDCLDYVAGFRDWNAKMPPPTVTSTSYDLGRAKAARDAELTADVLAAIDARFKRSQEMVRHLLVEANRPDLLAEYDARMAAIKGRVCNG